MASSGSRSGYNLLSAFSGIAQPSDEPRRGIPGRPTAKREVDGGVPLAQDPHSPSISTVRVLLVEDDEKLARSVRAEMELEGYRTVSVGNAEDAFRLLSESLFHVVLLDIMLPGKSGLQLLTWMRANQITTPVALMTARDAVNERVLGLDSGADDYLVKPFALAELSARTRALVRRHGPSDASPLKCADLEIDAKTYSAKRSGTQLALTLREFELLQYLCHNKGCVVTREMLARDIWKENNRCMPMDNIINVHMAHLRQKVDGDFGQKLLHTVRRIGFILQEPAT